MNALAKTRSIPIMSPLTKNMRIIGLQTTYMYSYFEKLDILFEYLFGFCKGRSTTQANETADTLRKALDNNLHACGFFLVFSKAFNMVIC